MLRKVSLNLENSCLIRSRNYIARLDGIASDVPLGWLNHHWIQLGYQLADSVSGGAYSFVGTCIILGALDFIGRYVPALRLRASPEEEILGIDDVEIGEFAVSLKCPILGISMLINMRSMIMLSYHETSSRPRILMPHHKIQVRTCSSCQIQHTCPKSTLRRVTIRHVLFAL